MMTRASPDAAAPSTRRLWAAATDAQTTHLAVTGDVGGEKRRDIQKQVLDLLAENSVLTRAKLREVLSVKNERLGQALESLQQAGRISRTPTGWQRTH